MPRHADEIKYLLDQSAALDAFVQEFAKDFVAWNESQPIQGITYSVSGSGFAAALFGVKLGSRYDQVKDGTGEFPDLFGRLSICAIDDKGLLGKPIHTILFDKHGAFSVDGTKDVRFHRGDRGLRTFGFKAVSTMIASMVVDNLETLS